MGKVLSCIQCVWKAQEQYQIVETAAKLFSTATPEEHNDFKEAFDAVKDDDGEVDAYQLRQALNKAFSHDFEFKGFTIDMCRSMVAMKDYDISGQLGYEECRELWDTILGWRNSFKKWDTDSNGYIEENQLEEILQQLGINVSGKTLQILLIRYKNKDGHIYFEDYISAMLKMKTMTDIYEEQRRNSPGEKASFTMDQFMQMTVYC